MDNDQKLANFERLAKSRVEKALKSIALISNLSNHATYHYTPQHIEQMFSALRDAVDKAEASFQQKPDTAVKFNFAGIDTSNVDFSDDDEDADDEADSESEAAE